MKLTLPTMLTFLRILLIPVLIIVFHSPLPGAHVYATGIFILAGFSDWLDGYLARKMGLYSRFGAFLDPVADKLMVTTAMVMLLQQNATVSFMLCTTVIIGREIAISALREWMAELGRQENVAVSMIGKIKTAAQMLAITLLLYRDTIGGYSMHETGLFILYLAVILTLWSMLQYLIAAWPLFNERRNERA